MWNSMADVTVNICFLYWLPVFHISSENSQGDKWDSIYTGMKDAIIGTLLSMQDIVECRKHSFELFGADFMLTEDYRPWLVSLLLVCVRVCVCFITWCVCVVVIDVIMCLRE
eukprot:scpid101406/ scgid5637/ Tubulin monoglycylase TTLL3; HOTTL; Tubulin--tyrosine ligase-like protein 3